MPERGFAHPRAGPWLAAALLTLAMPLAADTASDPKTLIEQAKGDLARRDGIAAEVRLKQALAAGVPRDQIAARMGEALIVQDQRGKAREWLGPGRFAFAEAAHGFRMLGLLERLDGNLPASGKAYDRAIAINVRDPALWVDIGRLRYAGGEHLLAIEAADYALQLDPANVRALEFRGQLVRDQFGLAGALPWFEAALAQDPKDIQVLGEYAATLGELGRARDMLTATRKMLAIDARNPKAWFLQAVLAARADDNALARSLLARTDGKLDTMPAKLLLQGVLEMRKGNNLLAIEVFEQLVRIQPANDRAQALLASAYYAQGNYALVVRRFASLAAEPGASAYLLTVVARAHEVLGERQFAVPLLERAADAQDRAFSPVSLGSEIGGLIAQNSVGAAAALAEQRRAANPGSYDAQALAGDAQFALDRPAEAVERYKLAARVRLPDSLLRRMAAALASAGQADAAEVLVEGYLMQNPGSRGALRLAAGFSARRGDWSRTAVLLDTLRRNGGGKDVRLLADLALAQLRSGSAERAAETGSEAYRQQPSSALAAQAWGLSLAALKQRRVDARALLDKARSLGGDNAELAEARRRLGD